jgi:alkylation response protein AidB-like acyl-CoA dehydrogenase
MADNNPLIEDRTVAFLLFEVLEADALCELPFFAEHSRETFELLLRSAAKLAREVVFPTYRPMDQAAAHFDGVRVHTHGAMAELYPLLVDLGLLAATRPVEVGGQQLPSLIASAAASYITAANLSAYAFTLLTSGAAHLIEAFGDEPLKQRFMLPMYEGHFTGTMALTEPEAGSSLADIRARARATAHGHYLIDGAKVFISGGDHSFRDNIVHLVLARVEGAAPGVKGISLFAVPKLRWGGQQGWVDNDVRAAGAFHKLGWRGIPSIALQLGENADCHGYLVGKPNQGLPYMFQMMNEARLQIGLCAVATAAVAYQESLAYARNRPQGRRAGSAADSPQVAIIEHADVRRMLLRQKAIVEGGLCLVFAAARAQDVAQHGATAETRARSQQLLELLTPIAKTFCAERGFEANALALQIHGGYGYTSEYLPEAWLRDQKLNSIHEGTTGIQSQDLLGRKILRGGGEPLLVLREEVAATLASARDAGVGHDLIDPLANALTCVCDLTAQLRRLGEPARALDHSADYLDMLSTLVIGWQWLQMATVAQRALQRGASDPDRSFYMGKIQAARYWFATDLPRIAQLTELCRGDETSYVAMQDSWF